jgi:hypothetical protein
LPVRFRLRLSRSQRDFFSDSSEKIVGDLGLGQLAK